MSAIKLDLRKLLGFKIIADGESVAKLHSPKIGAKGCTVTDSVTVTSGESLKTGLKPSA